MKCVSGLAVGAAVFLSLVTAASAEKVNRVLKDDGPGMPIVPASARGGFLWQGLYVGASLGIGSGDATQTYNRAGDHGVATLEPSGGAAATDGRIQLAHG